MDGKKLQPHPLADLLPMMSPAELAALKADISASGVREPGVLLDGKLLDGRNRNLICQELGIDFPTRDYNPKKDGPSPLAFVYSKAVHRNLSESQKAAAAVGILDALESDAEARKLSHLKQFCGTGVPPVSGSVSAPVPQRKLVSGKTRAQMAAVLKQNGNGRALELKRKFRFHCLGQRDETNVDEREYPSQAVMVEQILNQMYGPENKPANGKSVDQAGSLFGVSGRYVAAAKALAQGDKKLFRAVFDGSLPLTRAHNLHRRATRAKEQQKKLAAVRTNCQLPTANCQLITGDCLAELEKLDRHSATLIFADPPYNLGFKYDADPTKDKLDPDTYVKWCAKWLEECHRVLTPHGTLCLLHCEEYQHFIGCVLQEAGFTIRRLIVWYETFGECCASNFGRTCRFLYYATKKPDDFIFHVDPFLTESARQQLGDKRAMPGGKILDALWQISRLQGTSSERVGEANGPTQLPLALLTRIVNGFSDPGDLVIDPFAGTGTTGHAAILAHRRFLGIERSPKYAALARQRLTLAAAELATTTDH